MSTNLSPELTRALIDALWAAYRGQYEANAVWDTDPGAPRRYDEFSDRRVRLTAALCDGDDELEAWMDDHIFDLIDEGADWLFRMFTEKRSELAVERVSDALCVLADYRALRKGA